MPRSAACFTKSSLVCVHTSSPAGGVHRIHCQNLLNRHVINRSNVIIRPHRSTRLMRPVAIDGVAWSVGLSVGHKCELCKNGWTDRDAFWMLNRVGLRNGVLNITGHNRALRDCGLWRQSEYLQGAGNRDYCAVATQGISKRNPCWPGWRPAGGVGSVFTLVTGR